MSDFSSSSVPSLTAPASYLMAHIMGPLVMGIGGGGCKSADRLTNYFRSFFTGYAKLAGKLTKLLAKETSWGGGDIPSDAIEAFNCLHEKPAQAPILAFPRSGVPFILVTDVSLKHGYGGVLLQFQNGRNSVIAYFSCGLKAHENTIQHVY